MRNLQKQVKEAFFCQKLFWPFTVWINCSSDLINFANSRLSAWNFKSFSRSLEHFFLSVGKNNFGNKIPFVENFLAQEFTFVRQFARKTVQQKFQPSTYVSTNHRTALQSRLQSWALLWLVKSCIFNSFQTVVVQIVYSNMIRKYIHLIIDEF